LDWFFRIWFFHGWLFRDCFWLIVVGFDFNPCFLYMS
jgi:hypothetical protein